MRTVTLFITAGLWLTASGQSQFPLPSDSTKESVAQWARWSADLYDIGMEENKDPFYVKEEVVRLLNDSAYRQSVYPAIYDWQDVVPLMKQMELKKAFWHMLNIYQQDTVDRDILVGTFLLYDSVMEIDKILVNTYYTYAFPDPRVCRIVNGKPEIFRPDILEKGLAATKELTGYIWAYRKQRAARAGK